MPGANPDGTAYYSDVIGDAAEIPNLQPVTDLPTTPDFTVSSVSALNSALSSATAGQSIELLDGNYGAWSPSKINTTTLENHETNKIRIFSRNPPIGQRIRTDASAGAYFTDITPSNSPGCRGISIENVTLNNFMANGANIGFVDLVGALGNYYRLTYSTGRMRCMHSVFDRAFSRSDGNGPCCQMNFLAAPAYLQHTIFCRAGGDNVQVQQTAAGGKVFLHDFAIWDQYVDNSGAHPDLFQTVNGRSVDIRRGILWQEPGQAGNKGAQGIALGDGVHVDTYIENVFVRCDLGRKISATSLTGTIDNVCTVGAVQMSETFGNADVTLTNSVMAVASVDNGTPYAVDPSGGAQNNTQYGSGNEETVFLNTSGDFRSWRDFLPVTTRDNGGIVYLQSLQEIWDGVVITPPDPDPPALTKRPLMTGRTILVSASGLPLVG